MNKNVLIVSYTFPPTGGAGVQRVSKFVKYLRGFGWEPIILTTSNPSVPLQDTSLLKDIPADVRIYKARTLEPSYAIKKGTGSHPLNSLRNKIMNYSKNISKNILLPDAQILWWPDLIKTLVIILKTEKIDCIFATSPPYSVLIPIAFIAKKYGIPLVSDFRDEWAFSREQLENTSKNILVRKLDIFFERYVLKNSYKFTAATQSYVESILSRHSNINCENGFVITNGYDVDDVTRNDHFFNNGKINILYTGTVWKATSLSIFMEAFKQTLLLRPDLLSKMLLKIIGRVVENEIESFEIGELDSCIELAGYIDHSKVTEEISSADILLLTLSELPGSEKIIPGKTFEYMASGKHIFAVLPEGETKQLLKKYYKNVTFASPRSSKDIAEKLLHLFCNIHEIKIGRCEDISGFSRKCLTSNLADIFDSCCKKSISE